MSCFHEGFTSTIWKYNIAAHFNNVHKEESPGTTKVLVETMEAVLNYKEKVFNTEHIKANMNSLEKKLDAKFT